MRRNGEWMGKPPLGYISIHDPKGKRTNIVPDPATAHLVRKMFELYATGNHSTLTVRSAITKQGLKSSVGKPLALSMVDHILLNPFYYGEMRSLGKLYPHKYMPLISRALFERGRSVRESWHKKPFQFAAKPFIFRGLLRCSTCACAMSPELAKGKYVYYACTNAKKDLCHKKIYVPEKELLKPVYEVLTTLSRMTQQRIDEIVEELRQTSKFKNVYHENAIDALHKEYNSIQERIDRLMDLLLDDSITKENYDRKLTELKDRQHDINMRLEDHTRADASYHTTAAAVLNLAKNALGIFESSDVQEKRSLLNFLLQNSVVKEKTLEFALRNPFDSILAMVNQPTELHALDVFRTVDWKKIESDYAIIAPLNLQAA